MHGILSFAQFGINRIEKVDLPTLHRYFTRIHESGESLLLLLNDLLDLSKLEAGYMDIQFTASDLNSAIKHCIRNAQALASQKGVTIHLTPYDQLEPIMIDVARIEQVIGNLLSNAIKFSEANSSIDIRVSEDEILHSGISMEALHIEIEDQGIGAPEDELETIFDKFIQSSKTSTGAGGTGLGLSICKNIVDAHHGNIWATHAEKQGTIMHVLLPLSQL